LIRYKAALVDAIYGDSGALVFRTKDRLISSQQLKAGQKIICALFHVTEPRICKIDAKVAQNAKTRNFSQKSGQNDWHGV